MPMPAGTLEEQRTAVAVPGPLDERRGLGELPIAVNQALYRQHRHRVPNGAIHQRYLMQIGTSGRLQARIVQREQSGPLTPPFYAERSGADF